jgi:hypothetical protein
MEFLKLLNCSTKEAAAFETTSLLNKMIEFKNLKTEVKDFIVQLKRLDVLSDINTEKY